MKSCKYALVVYCLLLLASCSSDDGEGLNNETPPVVGTYALTEINISIAQDPNADGTFSVNMVDELSCLNGLLNISADGSWDMSITEVLITSVTGDLYPVNCGNSQEYSGNWSFQNNQLNLNSTFFASFTYNDDELVENVNENLPGILNRKFERQ